MNSKLRSGGAPIYMLRCAPLHPVYLQVIERPAAEAQPASMRLDEVIAEFSVLSSPQDRLKLLVEYSKQLKPMPAEAKTDANRVMGCTAQVIRGIVERLRLQALCSFYRGCLT